MRNARGQKILHFQGRINTHKPTFSTLKIGNKPFTTSFFPEFFTPETSGLLHEIRSMITSLAHAGVTEFDAYACINENSPDSLKEIAHFETFDWHDHERWRTYGSFRPLLFLQTQKTVGLMLVHMHGVMHNDRGLEHVCKLCSQREEIPHINNLPTFNPDTICTNDSCISHEAREIITSRRA